MKGKKLHFDYYFITDRGLSRKNVIEDVEAALRAGVRVVQYREKALSTTAMIDEARKIADLCRKRALFIVNDRLDVALASNADGVHLGPDDMELEDARRILGKRKIIGVSVSSVEEAKRCEEAGADYVSLSPVFATATKKDAGQPLGLNAVKDARKKLRIPFTVIGGISQANLRSVLDAGATSVCMLSAVLKAKDVETEIRNIRRTIHEHAARTGKK
jgi:thiamine-phosphate pyrophosphorylase